MQHTSRGEMLPDVEVTYVPNITSTGGEVHRVFTLFAEDLREKILGALRVGLDSGMDEDR